MAKAVAPYIHPRLATIPHTGDSEKPTPMVVRVEFVAARDGRARASRSDLSKVYFATTFLQPASCSCASFPLVPRRMSLPAITGLGNHWPKHASECRDDKQAAKWRKHHPADDHTG
jgi:hypothetical protein